MILKRRENSTNKTTAALLAADSELIRGGLCGLIVQHCLAVDFDAFVMADELPALSFEESLSLDLQTLLKENEPNRIKAFL